MFPVSHEQKRTHASQGKWLLRHCTIGIKGSLGVQLGPIMPGYVSTSDKTVLHNLQHVPEKDSFRLVQETKDNCEHNQVYGNKFNDRRELNSERVKTRQEINVWC